MFEFTLSKLNMLIFVTAIAAIVLFFMNTVDSNLKTRQSYELAFTTGKSIKSIMDTESFCSIKYIEIPKKIKTNQGNSNTYNINYKMNLQNYEYEKENPNNPDELLADHKLVIAITDRKEKLIYAAYDIDYLGEITFYNSDCSSGSAECNYTKITDSTQPLVLDPLREHSNDTRFVVFKKIEDNLSKYYIMPCEKRYGIDSCKSFVCNEENHELSSLKCTNIQICQNQMDEE